MYVDLNVPPSLFDLRSTEADNGTDLLERINTGEQDYQAGIFGVDVQTGEEVIVVVGEREVGVVDVVAADRHFLQEAPLRHGWQLVHLPLLLTAIFSVVALVHQHIRGGGACRRYKEKSFVLSQPTSGGVASDDPPGPPDSIALAVIMLKQLDLVLP